MHTSETRNQLLSITVQIVAAHVGSNHVPADAVSFLIKDVHATLASIVASEPPEPPHDHAHAHVASHGETDDYLVCLEDGLTMKMLKRHLVTVHGLTPDQYRAKWDLPSDYPMVAANYAKLRSTLARESGLGLRPEARPKRRRG